MIVDISKIREVNANGCYMTPAIRALFLKEVNESARQQGVEISEYELSLMMQSFNRGLDLGATMLMETSGIVMPED